MTTAEKLAVVIHNMIMEERRGCAAVAKVGGYDAAAIAILEQPIPVPSLKNLHCFLCAEGTLCTSCGMPVVVGKCVGLEP